MKAAVFTTTQTVEAMRVSADWKDNDALLTWADPCAVQYRDGESLIIVVSIGGSGFTHARPGDWIVRASRGFLVKTAEVFAREYKPA